MGICFYRDNITIRERINAAIVTKLYTFMFNFEILAGVCAGDFYEYLIKVIAKNLADELFVFFMNIISRYSEARVVFLC